MSLAKLYGAKRIDGLHEEDHRFPYATLAMKLDPHERDHFAYHVRRKSLWTDGGLQMARKIAGSSKALA